jgi:hypothetical protein
LTYQDFALFVSTITLRKIEFYAENLVFRDYQNVPWSPLWVSSISDLVFVYFKNITYSNITYSQISYFIHPGEFHFEDINFIHTTLYEQNGEFANTKSIFEFESMTLLTLKNIKFSNSHAPADAIEGITSLIDLNLDPSGIVTIENVVVENLDFKKM